MFASPLGLLALLGVPAVIALHLFRRRFRRHEVSALFLWTPRDRTSVAGRKRQPLRTSPSFWLEVFAALVAALAFAGPRACSTLETEHLVCVLDGSASMSADTGSESIRERAVAALEKRIRELSSDSRVTLIQSGTPPRILVGPSAFAGEALAALRTFEPGAPGHSLAPSLALADRFAAGRSIWLLTDSTGESELPGNVSVTAFGSPLSNLAIVAASRVQISREGPASPGSAREQVLVTVQSFASGRVKSTLSLYVGERQLAIREVDLAEGERAHFTFDLVGSTSTVEARLPQDALAIDNRATLAPTPPRTLAVFSNLDSETEQRLGLTSSANSPSLNTLLRLLPECTLAPNAHTAHLVFNGDLSAPMGAPTTWALTLTADSSEDRQDLVGPFLIERDHPVFRGVTLDGIIWSRNPQGTPPGSPIASAGNEAIFTEQVLATRRLYFANLDPARSSLQRSPDWPILLSNLAELRRDELPGARATSISSGEPFVWLGKRETSYIIEGPDLEFEQTARGALQIDRDLPPGSYELRANGTRLCSFGVTFADAAESDLRDLASGDQSSQVELASIDSGSHWILLVLLALVLALVLCDWLVLTKHGRLSSGEEES